MKKNNEELKVAYKELAFLNEEIEKQSGDLTTANKEIVLQHKEKEKRAD